MDTVQIDAEPRTVLGKKVKLLRQQGLVPANVYGHHLASVPLQLPEKLVAMRVARAGRSTLFSLQLGNGEPRTVLVKEVQRHPVSGKVLHVDFFQVAMTEMLRASVPLHFVGEAPAVRETGGTLLHNITSVEVESLPADLPSSIEVDMSSLATLDDALHVSDLRVPDGVEVLTGPDELIAKVAPPAVEEAPAAAPVEAAAEGEQPAEATAESPTSE